MEAYKEMHVRNAIKGLALFYQRQVVKVRKEEAPSVFELDKATTIDLRKHQWARVNQGLYKGDFGKVMQVDVEKKGAWVRIIPRLNTGEEKGQVRPTAKLFNPAEHPGQVQDRYRHPRFGSRVKMFQKQAFKYGFLYKFFTL